MPVTSAEMKGIRSTGRAAGQNKLDLNRGDAGSEPMTPFINILYFIPRSRFHSDLQIKGSSFLFPDDSSISGSMSLFRCLLRQLLDKDLLGIGHMQRTENGEPQLVVLFPCDEATDAEGYMEQPGGLYTIPVPYIEDIRNIIAPMNISEPTEESADPCVSAAIGLVSSMQFKPSFQYKDLESPGIQYFYSMLQAIALADEKCEWNPEQDDMLQPDQDSLQANESRISHFNSITGLANDVEESTRKASAVCEVDVVNFVLTLYILLL